MKKKSKSVFFIVTFLILALTYTTFFGISTTYGDIKKTYVKSAADIRWGIDIRGGVDVTFTPPEGTDATDTQMDAAQSVIETRLVGQNITDYEIYTDYKNDRIVVRFPWKEDETDFNPEEAIKELGATALLTFREGYNVDSSGKPTGVTAENVILEGSDVKSASVGVDNDNEIVVLLDLESSGKEKFSEATGRLKGQIISIWMDDTCISYPKVSNQITDGSASISGGFTADEAKSLANQINSGALPFKLETQNYSSINPKLGTDAKDAMVLAGLLGYIAVAIFMVLYYRVPGFVAAIGLMGQATASVAAVSGYFPFVPSFTLTLPGIAGIILSIGFGVDANVITSERIKEELKTGKTLDGSISAGYERGFSAIFDGNVTSIIIALILMGAYGAPDSFMAKALTPFFFMFGPTTAGAIYSFGYTLLIGVICNFIFGVTASRLMLKSISKFSFLRKPWLYGGAK